MASPPPHTTHWLPAPRLLTPPPEWVALFFFPFLTPTLVLARAVAHLEGVEEVPEGPGVDDVVVHGEEEGDHHAGNPCKEAEGCAED